MEWNNKTKNIVFTPQQLRQLFNGYELPDSAKKSELVTKIMEQNGHENSECATAGNTVWIPEEQRIITASDKTLITELTKKEEKTALEHVKTIKAALKKHKIVLKDEVSTIVLLSKDKKFKALNGKIQERIVKLLLAIETKEEEISFL